MEVADKPKTHRSGGRCRLGDAPASASPPAAGRSFRRATEADRPEIGAFQTRGVSLAGDRDIAIEACIGGSDKTDKAMQGHAWIAREAGKVVGLIWIAVSHVQVAHIAGMCVDPGFHSSQLPGDLLAYALRFCRDAGILKVVLGTHLPEQEAWALFGKCGYDISRRRRQDGHHVMEFYLNLYKRPDCEGSPSDIRRRREDGQRNEPA